MLVRFLMLTPATLPNGTPIYVNPGNIALIEPTQSGEASTLSIERFGLDCEIIHVLGAPDQLATEIRKERARIGAAHEKPKTAKGPATTPKKTGAAAPASTIQAPTPNALGV